MDYCGPQTLPPSYKLDVINTMNIYKLWGPLALFFFKKITLESEFHVVNPSINQGTSRHWEDLLPPETQQYPGAKCSGPSRIANDTILQLDLSNEIFRAEIRCPMVIQYHSCRYKRSVNRSKDDAAPHCFHQATQHKPSNQKKTCKYAY